MRRGSISERRMKCGKPTCPCQQDATARHGPYFSLTWAVAGKTRTRYVTSQQVAVLRQQIEAGQRFREQVEDYWEACQRWADQELEAAATSSEVAEKKGFPRPSNRRSAKRSKP
jgi:hypothetical protein